MLSVFARSPLPCNLWAVQGAVCFQLFQCNIQLRTMRISDNGHCQCRQICRLSAAICVSRGMCFVWAANHVRETRPLHSRRARFLAWPIFWACKYGNFKWKMPRHTKFWSSSSILIQYSRRTNFEKVFVRRHAQRCVPHSRNNVINLWEQQHTWKKIISFCSLSHYLFNFMQFFCRFFFSLSWN